MMSIRRQLAIMEKRHCLPLLSIILLGATASSCFAQQPATAPAPSSPSEKQANDPDDILNMDIDQLSKVDMRTPSLNIEVTSVSKQESTVGRSAAAIYVITSEMIARSPATNIPDLLRMVPGMEVARIDAHAWAVISNSMKHRKCPFTARKCNAAFSPTRLGDIEQ